MYFPCTGPVIWQFQSNGVGLQRTYIILIWFYSERESNPYPPVEKGGIEITLQPVNRHGYTPTN